MSEETIQNEKTVGLKRTIGLKAAIGQMLGIMIGSGIFFSNKSVLMATQSIGACLIMWIACGVVSLLGALCYIELSALVPDSGAEIVYIYVGFKYININLAKLLSFLTAWSLTVIIFPIAISIGSLACSTYILGLFFDQCTLSDTLLTIGAFVVLFSVTFLNAYNVKLANSIIVWLTFTKIFALGFIITGGIVRLCLGYTKNFENLFEGTNTNILQLASGFYGGMWAFDGWNNLNSITEEIINPERNLTLATILSVVIAAFLYLFTNISYFTAMSKNELIASDAVAITWSNIAVEPYLRWVLPVSIALGSLSNTICLLFSTSRLNYASAKKGFLMNFLTMIDIERNTPLPSIIFSMTLSCGYLLFFSDLGSLIEMISFTLWLFYALSFIGLVILKAKMKNVSRPIKLPSAIPIIVFFISVYFVFAPIIDDPKLEYIAPIFINAVGILVFIVFVHLKINVNFITRRLTEFIQLLFKVSMPDNFKGYD